MLVTVLKVIFDNKPCYNFDVVIGLERKNIYYECLVIFNKYLFLQGTYLLKVAQLPNCCKTMVAH